MIIRAKAFVAIGFVLAANGISAHGGERGGKPDALLACGMKNSPTAVSTARDEFDRLKTVSPNDPRINFAYGLVLINQHRYRQAIPFVESYLLIEPNDLQARQTLLHTQMLDRNYAAALVSCQTIAEMIHSRGESIDARQTTAAANFLGTVFGYLEIRGAAAMASDRLSKAKNRVLTELGEGYLDEFDRGRQAALALFQQAEDDLQAIQSRTQAANEQQRAEVQSTLAGDRTKAVTDRNAAQQSGEQLREAQREYDVVVQQVLPLVRDRTQISVQLMAIQGELSSLLMSATPGQIARRSNPNSIGFAERVQANSLSLTLASLNRQALDLDRRILALQTRAGELVTSGAKASEELAESTAALAKSEKRAKNLEKQLARAERKAATKAAAAKAPAITGRMAQFSTYAPFPYEQEKERVLSWYAK
jgi:hypothetical protein